MGTIACIGDSLTEGADVDKGFRWTSLVANALGQQVYNCGIGGDTTQGMLARFYPQVLGLKPDYVIITGGTNDLWWDAQIPVILSNLFSIVCQARYNDITPVIGLPLPVDLAAAEQQAFAAPLAGYERFNENLSLLIKNLKKAADNSEVALIDFYSAFLTANGQVDGALYVDDGLHPNNQGHAKMARRVVDMMQNAFHF